MIREVYLHGSLKARFGGPFSLDVSSPAEAVRALGSQLEGFFEAIRAGSWHVLRGELEEPVPCDQETLLLMLGRVQEVHILPEASGGKKGGLGQALLGVVIVAAAVVAAPLTGGGSLALGSTALSLGGLGAITFADIAFVGLSLALTGVSSILAPSPSAPDVGVNEPPDQRPSHLFNGEVNVSEQGHPVPVGCGRFRVGSIVVSAGISAERV